MGIRIKNELRIQAGFDNSLDDCFFDRSVSELLDTLDHGNASIMLLEAGSTDVAVPFGDVAQARILYIEADGEFEVELGGGAATGAAVTGVGGSFPTGFAGGEAMSLDIDNLGAVAIVFTVSASLVQDVANEINAAFALAGVLSGGLPVAPASVSGGEIRITSPTTGLTSEVDAVSADAAVLTALGISVSITNGVNANPGTSDLNIDRPADPAGASAAAGVTAFFYATVNTDQVLLTNLSPTVDINVKVLIVGDLTASP